MNNIFLNCLKDTANIGYTENLAVKHFTTESALLDMFAMGGSMRTRSDADVILMFKKAFEENPVYAIKCLFYLRDCREGAGERRFFRVCMKWLANEHPEVVRRNMEYTPVMGRWDDLYCLEGTILEEEMFEFMKKQFFLDLNCKTPSLLSKWLCSENASSKETQRLGALTAKYFGLTHKQYRKHLSTLRSRINIVEKLMSENRFDEIEFDKIPSRAGLLYKNAFARRDIIKEKYEKFAKDKTKKVNADVLNPVDIAGEIFRYGVWSNQPSETERLMWDKYWANLKDYYNGKEEPGISIVDVSGSMSGQPMNAAVAMGAYIAERGKGPFQNHFITFSNNPQLVEFEGIDLYDKFQRARKTDWGNSTNLEATFDMLLNTALRNNLSQEDMPKTLYIFSDQEFNGCISCGEPKYQRNSFWGYTSNIVNNVDTLVESIKKKWTSHGYKMPRIIFWNLACRNENIPAIGEGFSYVSGFSMNMIEQILSGRDGYDLMMMKLDSNRYARIQ